MFRAIVRDFRHGLSLNNKLGYKVLTAHVAFIAGMYVYAIALDLTHKAAQ